MSRRKGRVLAFQGLYSWDVGKNPLEEILAFTWPEAKDEEAEAFAGLVINGAVEHIEEIDKKIESHLSDSWTMERINKVSLSILRMSVYELMFQSSAESKVVIDEAVEIAKKYGEDGSFKFINAVLDNIRKETN
ncbi:MAG: transcription antitermination factor NusB [Treponema sp.]|nr:transcription antitermination factor NusB [Treponema sp.]